MLKSLNSEGDDQQKLEAIENYCKNLLKAARDKELIKNLAFASVVTYTTKEDKDHSTMSAALLGSQDDLEIALGKFLEQQPEVEALIGLYKAKAALIRARTGLSNDSDPMDSLAKLFGILQEDQPVN